MRHALVDAGAPRSAGRRTICPAARPGTWAGGNSRSAANQRAALADVVELHDAAIASSGDDAYCFTADRRLHHILDPHSGRSPRELVGVTVIAADACTADALSTACMVLGIERSQALVESLSGIEALFVRKDGRIATSKHWPGRRRSV